ncbi:MAG: serine hydrolase [Cryomorphaceae bacterium]|nr:serine hydrolase [Cryomorphaceae bacterium]
MRNTLKWLIRLTGGFIIFAALLSGLLYITGNGYLIKGIRATYMRGETSATIDDRKFFHQREIKASNPQQLVKHPNYGKYKLPKNIRAMLKETKTSAFVIIKNDMLLYEDYPLSDEDFLSNSFSMAKSVVSLLAQIANEEGTIHWNDPVKKYIPELKGPYADSLQIWHLSTMTAGLDWEEHYKNPLSDMAQAYYGPNVDQMILDREIVNPPGKKFTYHSASTQLLGMVLSRATGKTLSAYLEEKLWGPLGMESDATWHLDGEEGSELAYCCINATARDFARLGMLVKNKGKVNGEVIIPQGFFFWANKGMFSPKYGWSFWVTGTEYKKIGYFRGVWGQYIIPLPEKDVVIVRLGKRHLPMSDGSHPDDVHELIHFALEQL